MGKGLVDQLKKEFEIKDEWVSFEIHPETPPEGTPLSEKFPGMNLKQMRENLNLLGAPYGIHFGPLSLLSNSRLALLASEYARDAGKYESFHAKIFYATFTESKDIGDIQVILDIAESIGLDREELRKALDEGKYMDRLEKAQELGRMYGVTGTPTFIINGKYKIVGAQRLELFQKALKQIEEEETKKA